MKAVRVHYKVHAEYTEQIKRNIQDVMDALKANPIKGMYYSTYQLEDGDSFMHLNVAEDDETMSKLNEVDAFKNFRTQLKASGPLSPPKAEKIELVGASWAM